jgi:MFS family permease
MFLMSVAIGIIPPILPLIREHFGISVGAVALVVSCFGMARLLADLPAGFLADRLNQLNLLRLGAVFLIVGSIISSMAGSFLALVVAQAFRGIGSATCSVASLSILGAISTSRSTGRIIGNYYAFMFASLMVSPIVSGFLALRYTWRSAFLFDATMGLLALAILFLLSREEIERRSVLKPEEWAESVPSDFAGWRFKGIILYLLWAGLWLFAGCRTALIPNFAVDELGLRVDAVGLILGIGSGVTLFTLYLSGRIGDQLGKPVIMGIGLMLYCLAAIFLTLSRNVISFALSVFIFDMAGGFFFAAPYALLSDITPNASKGRTMGFARLSGDIGVLSGPLLLGYSVNFLGYRPSILLILAPVIVGMLFLVYFWRVLGRYPGLTMARQ